LQYYVAGQEDIRGGLTCTFHIHRTLPLFAFHLAGRDDNTFGNLVITSGTNGEVLQTIENSTDPNALAPAKAETALTVVDANFDGYQDLQLLSFCSAKTCSYNFYLYDPKANRFVLDKFLSRALLLIRRRSKCRRAGSSAPTKGEAKPTNMEMMGNTR